MRNKIITLSVLCAVTGISNAVETESLPIVQVEGQAESDFDVHRVTPETQVYVPADTATLLEKAPGANVNKNGALTGIVQYRGMFGTRVNVQVDGLNIAPAGPNWMDPPLSNIPTQFLDSLTVVRGVSPVSAGSETIGGTVAARSKRIRFGDSDAFEFSGEMLGGYESANGAWSAGVLLGAANQHQRMQFQGSWDDADNLRVGEGDELIPSGYRRKSWALGYGVRNEVHTVDVTYQHNRVDDSGTPALPMDVIFLDGDLYNLEYTGSLGAFELEGRLHYQSTDHRMDNFSWRAPTRMANGMRMRRFAITDSNDWAWDLRASTELAGGLFSFGTDGWLAGHNADIFSPDNAGFQVENYNDIERDRLGLFGEWEGELGKGWNLLAGLRYTHVHSDAGEVSAQGLGMTQPLVDSLVAGFNSADRSRNDDMVDLAVKLGHVLSATTTVELGLGIKHRAPSYQERYLWLPLESTAGLADRRTYIGDPDLDPETAYNIDLGLNWGNDDAYFTPRVFYKRVDDYIQGTSLTEGTALSYRRQVGNMIKGNNFCTDNPDAAFCVPLQFTNVDAEFYGFDAGFGMRFDPHWFMDGSISYVRGKRRDISDNLYRIAPLNATLALTYRRTNWSLTAEGVFYAAQDDVSETNAEQATPGYGIVNLLGSYRVGKDLTVNAGVNNLFDRLYYDHLAGYNRVSADEHGEPVDLAVGDRIPGAGRSLFVRATLKF